MYVLLVPVLESQNKTTKAPPQLGCADRTLVVLCVSYQCLSATHELSDLCEIAPAVNATLPVDTVAF
jgi:hypothetical protein